jgi:hypothetical protein
MTWLTKQHLFTGVLIASLAVPPYSAIAVEACDKTAGQQEARRYVEQCLKVSPATHPPCNTANSCALIRDEIQRGCALLGADAPEFCRREQRSDLTKPWPRLN